MKDIDEIRRDNLRHIEQECGGPSATAELVGMSPGQFVNLRDGAKDSKTGKARGMRKETARRIEVAAGKPKGWLDVDHLGALKTDSTSLKATGIEEKYLSLSKEKQSVIDYFLLSDGEPAPEWVDRDARAYADSLKLKARGWLERGQTSSDIKKNRA
ncbi:hypothetical protein GTU79_21315 [Sodalis ligni]|uniref:hypothetical protein n=1 Tax=Sodalis ligni TaxID=2697027 RepID=UPI00193FC96E|nr:hypothetical protein [Sodalis ligni]QWA09823.1 hypothetical protein GTU79_21315 [Sodalis ligni]